MANTPWYAPLTREELEHLYTEARKAYRKAARLERFVYDSGFTGPSTYGVGDDCLDMLTDVVLALA